MNYRPLASPTRIGCKLAAGVAAFAFVGLAAAPGASAGEPPRASLSTTSSCNNDGTATAFEAAYDDHTDGHVPVAVHQELIDNGVVINSWDEVHQVGSDYRDSTEFSITDGSHDGTSTYVYSVTITYDDGLSQTNTLEITPNQACVANPPQNPPAPAPATPGDEARFVQSVRAICDSNGTPIGIEVGYDDLADGHVPQSVLEEVFVDGEGVWLTDELHQVNGDFFNSHRLTVGAGLPTFDANAEYFYGVDITYDDGAGRHEWVSITPNAGCASPPATTVPGGVLPATGADDATWVIGALGGLLLMTGSALFAGGRRSRSD